MAFMKKLFGGGSGGGGSSSNPQAPSRLNANTANNTIQTISMLKEQEENLEKRKSLLEKRVEEELEKARAFTKLQKKPQALMCLKKKKLLETAVTNMDNMLMRVIEQRNELENQTTTAQVIAGLSQANKQAKDIMKQMDVENVDQVIDDIRETQSQMQQIHEAMGQSAVDIDEDELLGELEELEATEMDKELLKPAPVPVTKVPAAAQAASAPMPSVPATKAKPKAKTAEEEELAALEAEMAL